jgi:TonB family protein
MNGVNFIIESGISLAALSLIYITLFRRDTFFAVNRGFLLFSVLFSIILPLLHFRILDPRPNMLPEITVSQYRGLLETVTIYSQNLSGEIERSVSSATLIIVVYFAGLAFFLGRFLLRIAQLIRLIQISEIQKNDGFYLVETSKPGSPFSFLNYVFINPVTQKHNDYQKLITHELEHIRQGHTFDILILEILSIFQWFNPFMWILKRAVKENHEYLADQGVLTKGINRGQYKLLLLQEYAGVPISLTNGFNTSMIKRRIWMMSKLRSSWLANTKLIAGILVVAALIVIFACEQKKSAEIKPVTPTSLTTSFENGNLKIEGTPKELAEVKKMFAEEDNFDIIENDSLGYILVAKRVIREVDKNSEIFYTVETMPKFPGGDEALRNFIFNAVDYPKIAREKGIQGKVYVQFVITTEGKVASAKIPKSVHPLLDREALRVINKMPDWEPGYQKGKPVNVAYTIPINFVLQ